MEITMAAETKSKNAQLRTPWKKGRLVGQHFKRPFGKRTAPYSESLRVAARCEALHAESRRFSTSVYVW